MNQDNLITYSIIGIAIAGLLFLSFGSTGQFIGLSEDPLDNHVFDSDSDYDDDGVSDFVECPGLEEFSDIHLNPASLGRDLGFDPMFSLDLNKLSGAVFVLGPDIDFDEIPNDEDNCPDVSNPNQEDQNDDGVGDACDDDDDGVANNYDNCPSVSNPNQEDSEIGNNNQIGDGVGDACDNCPDDLNFDQSDSDNDGIGTSCDDIDDNDNDNDGWTNYEESQCQTNQQIHTEYPEDTDGDGTCDYIDEDDDGDEWSDLGEILCDTDPLDSNDVPTDFNGDGMCDEPMFSLDFADYGFTGYTFDCYIEQDGTLNCYLINSDGDTIQTYEDTSDTEPIALYQAYKHLYDEALDNLGCTDSDSDGTPDWADDRYPGSCTDTDGGEEDQTEIFGTVTSILGAQTTENSDCCALANGDFCKNAGPTVIERSCLTDNTATQTHDSCSSGYCESGECLTDVPFLLSDEVDEVDEGILISKQSGHLIDGTNLIESQNIIWQVRDAHEYHKLDSQYPDETGWSWFIQTDTNQDSNPGTPLIDNSETDMTSALDEIDEYIRNTLGEMPPETNRWNYLYRGYQYSISDLENSWVWDVWDSSGNSLQHRYSISGQSSAIESAEDYIDGLLDGCMDRDAENYKSTAIEDTATSLDCIEFGGEDGKCSCVYEGCTDDIRINGIEIATNYDEFANTDDGSCIYWGCPDVTAINYDETVIGTELENEDICGYSDMFNERACTAVITNTEYSGEALSIIQISHAATVKEYRAEILDLDPNQNQIISILSPSDYTNAFDCEVFLWEDFNGKPIEGTSYWRYGQ
jgi:hypothetical protein